jgi:protein-disulfide isomerase
MWLPSCTQGVSKEIFNFVTTGDGTLVAKTKDFSITADDVKKGIENEIYEAEQKIYDLKIQKVKELLTKSLVAKDKKSTGLTQEQYLEKYVYKAVTDKEVDAFIVDKKLPKDQITPDVKERIKQYVAMEKNQKALDTWLVDQIGDKGVDLYLKKPVRPTFDVKYTEASPWKGGKDAKVTIIEFSDFQCPRCAAGKEIVDQIKAKYKDQVKVVFKHFPLAMHPQAKDASMNSMCFFEQKVEAFWKFHDFIFTHQDLLSQADVYSKQAKEQGLDMAKFEECVKAKKYASAIEGDVKQGTDLGINGTPTFFVNGQIVMGAQPAEVFFELIDSALK